MMMMMIMMMMERSPDTNLVHNLQVTASSNNNCRDALISVSCVPVSTIRTCSVLYGCDGYQGKITVF